MHLTDMVSQGINLVRGLVPNRLVIWPTYRIYVTYNCGAPIALLVLVAAINLAIHMILDVTMLQIAILGR